MLNLMSFEPSLIPVNKLYIFLKIHFCEQSLKGKVMLTR